MTAEEVEILIIDFTKSQWSKARNDYINTLKVLKNHFWGLAIIYTTNLFKELYRMTGNLINKLSDSLQHEEKLDYKVQSQ